jgi:hypothetical protein
MNEYLEQIVEEWSVAKYQNANSISEVSEFIGQLRNAGCDEQANRFWQMFLDELKRIEPKPEPQPRDYYEKLNKF